MGESTGRPDRVCGERVELAARANPVRKRRLIEGSDISLSILLVFLTPIAWLMPNRAWPWIVKHMVSRLSRKGSPDAILRGISLSGFSEDLGATGDGIDADLNANRIETYLQYLCDYRPGGWNARFGIENESALREASDSGDGVILWVAHFVYNGLPVKKGLFEAGYAVSHMSRPEHGFSTSRFGVRVLNPIRSRIELRYLKQRIIILREAEHVALRNAHRLLRKGGLVSFTAGAWEGRQIAKAPFGDARMPIATGAPALANATGARLLPVFIARDTSERGLYHIAIGERIECAGKDRDAAVRAAVADFARQLEPRVRAHPEQWRGWKYLEPAPERPEADAA